MGRQEDINKALRQHMEKGTANCPFCNKKLSKAPYWADVHMVKCGLPKTRKLFLNK